MICTRVETGDMRKGAERGAVLVSGGPSSETGHPYALPDLGRLGATRPHEDQPRDSETPPVKLDSRDQGCVTRALARAPLGTLASFSNVRIPTIVSAATDSGPCFLGKISG